MLSAGAPSGTSRQANPVNLVVVFFFALTAIVFLTRTAVAANAINRDVATAIQPATHGIDKSVRGLAQLDTTGRLSGQIAAAAKPLSGRLNGVVTATNQINSNIAAINTHTTSIDTSVVGIKHATGSIEPGIAVLGGHVNKIDSEAGDIAGDFASVTGLTSSVVTNLNGAEASLAAIGNGTAPLNGSVKDIQSSIGQINAHSLAIQNSPILLRPDLTSLLGNLLGGN